ncbi:MAG: 2TM domain-containing protein [Ignavibacteria bacterium]|nr:2TM domain-containing protein [Ignavibacteria bacterium]MBK7254501.1 2TM domain-containing protein [Ignavibacteria bacterium]MBK7447298.1 2TM domain-containing protein [Ignavibacteria bacterium]MBK8380641.1 2TM domain-containing protein [Ignavibacteria bacterium]MBK9405993.1 2TM domain-containing protein [Ignavibacteria bacterium]
MNEDLKMEEARKRVKALKGFYMNLFFYITINIFLIIVNLVTSPDRLWFYWVLFGWGIGIAFQAFSVFGKNAIFNSGWEEKKIKEYMDKNK